MLRYAFAFLLGCVFVGTFLAAFAQEPHKRPKEPEIEQFPLKTVSVKPFRDEFRVSVLIGTNNLNPQLVAFVFTSSVRSYIGGGSLKVIVPDENGGPVTVTIPPLPSSGRACTIVKCSEPFGKWIKNTEALSGEITSLAMKL